MLIVIVVVVVVVLPVGHRDDMEAHWRVQEGRKFSKLEERERIE
jgi:hypothetical protein